MNVADKPKMIHIIQGELHTTGEENVVLTTLLGSCVAVCLHDPISRVGGMNHFLLPGSASDTGRNISHGVHSMELLINQLIRLGGRKDRMVARVFGGANMLNNEISVGERNGAFALEFLQAEDIDVLGESLGGNRARRIRFWPDTGKAQQKFAKDPVEEKLDIPAPKAPASDIELF